MIGLKPDDTLLAAAYNVQGKAKLAQGNNKDSLIDYNKAIQLEPNQLSFTTTEAFMLLWDVLRRQRRTSKPP